MKKEEKDDGGGWGARVQIKGEGKIIKGVRELSECLRRRRRVRVDDGGAENAPSGGSGADTWYNSDFKYFILFEAR